MDQESNKNILTPLLELRFLPEEKNHARNALEAYLRTHAPRPTLPVLLMRHGVAVVFATLLLCIGGTAALAHRSLPGDLFYPVKLAMNDRIARAVAGDDDAKLDIELAQAERIIQEEEEAAAEMFDEEESELTDHSVDAERASANILVGAEPETLSKIDTELRIFLREFMILERDDLPEH